MHAAKRPVTIIHGNQLINLTGRALLAKFRADWLYGNCSINTELIRNEMLRRGYNPDYKEVTQRLK